MSKSNKSLRVTIISLVVIILFVSPFFFFNFQDSLNTPSLTKTDKDEKLILRSPLEQSVEEVDEDPRVIYMPDHEQGFSVWLNEKIDLPSLELPDMEIREADFYSEEDFPEAQNSLTLNLESTIRKEWPLPELEEDLPELELKKGLAELLVFVDEIPVENAYYTDEALLVLFTDISEEELEGPTLLSVKIEDDEMQVDLVHSCGVRKLENDFSKQLLRRFYKDKILSSITHKKGDRVGESTAFYLIEWRFAFSSLKK